MCSTFQFTFIVETRFWVSCPSCSKLLVSLIITIISGRVFFKIASALPDTTDLNDFLVLTRDNTFVAINESFIYPTKNSNTFIDEGRRPAMKYNLTLKYHPPLTQIDENQEPSEYYQEPVMNIQQVGNIQHSIQKEQSHPFCDIKVPSDENLVPSSRENVERSINKRNQLIQRLLHSQVDNVSPAKIENARFIDIPTQQPSPSDTYRHISPRKLENVRFVDVETPPLEFNTYRNPSKEISTSPQPQEDLMTWKANQQETFLMDLKKKENEHLMSLAKEWKIKQSKEEEKLESKMKNCKLLTEALEHALSAVKVCHFCIVLFLVY